MSTVKINWGARIALLYLGFVAIIATLVIGSMRQSFDLVTPDYYGEEIQFQKVIDAGKNQATLSSPIAVYANSSTVTLELPGELKVKSLTGTVQFYSPVNAAWDRKLAMNAENGKMTVPRSSLQNTRYTVKISCNADNKQYYQETEINLH